MQTFKSLIPFLLTAGLAVNAETTSCVTSTKTFPTITSIIVEPTSTWSGNGTGVGPHTVYTTEYHEFCSTGLRLHTYTITEACHKEKCQPRTTGVPPGFTSTVTVCNSCGEKPVTATLTVPCSEATPTKGTGKPQSEHCETCHDQGKPSGKPPVQPQTVPSIPAVKPVPTGPQPEECTTCSPEPPSAAPPHPPRPTNPGQDKPEHPNSPACTTCSGTGQQSQPPASLTTSIVPGPSGEKPATSPTGPAPGEPSTITAGAAKSSYVELGLLGIVGFAFILLGGLL
ncbi:uncharacterized protein FMAN_09650 [Fusarium mangiferae]|uniref:Sporozoite surface protein 2 n=1 Tax=Fusarium mangiferae TaxID=192010 RepID=A0A1L7UFR8_FUSMA|nr:uncharacterized protein FMAN_09650 [Fusarium mangiferae]CVL08032.1 uncharacterized protein FMAN_09650 [Fusarium mangiferae]